MIKNVKQITPKRGLDGRDEALELISGNGYRNLLLFEREGSDGSRRGLETAWR